MTQLNLGENFYDSSSSDDSHIDLQESSEEIEEEDENECVGCGETYLSTSKKNDWLQCVHCACWFHEGCSKYENLCDRCGKVITKKRT
jgi:hypothetical protein